MRTLTKNWRYHGGQAHEHTRKQNWNISTDMAVFLNRKRANVCKHMTKMASLEFLKSATRGLREEWMEGNLKEDYLGFITSHFKNLYEISYCFYWTYIFIKDLPKLLFCLRWYLMKNTSLWGGFFKTWNVFTFTTFLLSSANMALSYWIFLLLSYFRWFL